MITAIDSTRDAGDLLPVHEHVEGADASPGPFRARLGRGVVLDIDGLAVLLDDSNYFTGFDEVWLFEVPPKEPLPDRVVLTSDARVQKDPQVDAWIERTRCVVGLGDGLGLSYITPHRAVADVIEKAG